MNKRFPLEILDGESQLDRIEKKLDAIIQKFEIELEDTSREAAANRAELADFHDAKCQKNEFIHNVRDYLQRKEREHDNIRIKVLCPWSFDVRSTNLPVATNKVTLCPDERGDHFNAIILYRNGFLHEISIKRFPLLSDDTGVIANIYQCNFIESFADAIINRKIEVQDLGYLDVIEKCRSISEDFDEWWNGLCQVDDTVEGVIHVLKDINIAIEGNETGCFKADPNFPQGIKITRHNDDTADFEFAAFGHPVTANFNLLGRFLYHCIILGEIEIPCFKSWRICKYTGVWPTEKQMEETNG